MNLSQLSRKFDTQDKCIAHLEKVRWLDVPKCPYCFNVTHISKRKNENRYLCHNCNKSFSVLVDTIFEDTNLPLPIWFELIALMLNSKMGISSMELARDLGIMQKTAWFNAMKVRCAMLDESDMLEGIIEMDEAYFGGKPRKKNEREPADNQPTISRVANKRGRGTTKTAAAGIVSRGADGKVANKVLDRLTTRNLLALFKKHVNVNDALLITDEFRSYAKFDEVVKHLTINHQKEFSKGIIHTNTIEGFWSILKNGIPGNFRSISKKYLPFYLAEYCYKYNRRNAGDSFKETIINAVEDETCFVNLKPKGKVKKIVYDRKPVKKKVATKKPTIRKKKK